MKSEPFEIKVGRINLDTAFVCSFKTDENKAEYDDGTFCYFHNVNYSADWTRAKQAGYFWGRIMSLALTIDDINEDLQAWKDGLEPKENNVPSDL